MFHATMPSRTVVQRWPYAALFIVILFLLVRKAQIPSTEGDANVHYVKRIVATGDLHGDYEHFQQTMQMNGVAQSDSLTWSHTPGVRTVWVQTGDIVDRGDDVIKLYRTIDRLREEAADHGDLVVSVLGNHEVMNAQGDWRYATRGDVASFGGQRARAEAMSLDGWLGQSWSNNSYLDHVDLNNLRKITPLATEPPPAYAASFVHGGILPALQAFTFPDPVDYINSVGASLMSKFMQRLKHKVQLSLEERELWSSQGPLWAREYAYEDDDVACALANKTSSLLNAHRLVMGHTPTFEARSFFFSHQTMVTRCDGRVIIIDTGMSSAYGGVLSSLEILLHYTVQSSRVHVQEHMYGLYPGRRELLDVRETSLPI